jgi:hypothetical protein
MGVLNDINKTSVYKYKSKEFTKEDFDKILENLEKLDAPRKETWKKAYEESFIPMSEEKFKELSKLPRLEKAALQLYWRGMWISFLMYENIRNNMEDCIKESNIKIRQ